MNDFETIARCESSYLNERTYNDSHREKRCAWCNEPIDEWGRHYEADGEPVCYECYQIYLKENQKGE